MTEKIQAEGSVWKIADLILSDSAFARATGAVKATGIPGDIWRLYFVPGTTPSGSDLAKTLGVPAQSVENVVAADHKALVTPTL